MVFWSVTVDAFPFKAIPDIEPQHWGIFFLVDRSRPLFSAYWYGSKNTKNKGIINDEIKLSRK